MKVLTKNKELILATSSQTRINMMKTYEKNFIIKAHTVDETKLKKQNIPVIDCVRNMAEAKAKSLEHIYPDHKIIGSDQMLVCRNEIFNKPKSENQAIENLMKLQNNVHSLYSAIVVIQNKHICYELVREAKLFFKSMSEDDIKKYIKKNKSAVFSSVGSYKIEENDKFKFVEILSGDEETIVGFPISRFFKETKGD